jgi:hypothetical protein
MARTRSARCIRSANGPGIWCHRIGAAGIPEPGQVGEDEPQALARNHATGITDLLRRAHSTRAASRRNSRDKCLRLVTDRSFDKPYPSRSKALFYAATQPQSLSRRKAEVSVPCHEVLAYSSKNAELTMTSSSIR